MPIDGRNWHPGWFLLLWSVVNLLLLQQVVQEAVQHFGILSICRRLSIRRFKACFTTCLNLKTNGLSVCRGSVVELVLQHTV